jgi:hypothetical protein
MPPVFVKISNNAIRVQLPDVTQCHDFSCGAVCLEGISHYYGICPDEEDAFIKNIRFDHRVGANPGQLMQYAEHLGLRVRAREGMGLDTLRKALSRNHPVLLSIQAYGDRTRQLADYEDSWTDGHWVVGIGYDHKGIFIEDPSMQACRGYLTDQQLLKRWHDIGTHNKRLFQLGIEIWKPRGRNMYARQARLVP